MDYYLVLSRGVKRNMRVFAFHLPKAGVAQYLHAIQRVALDLNPPVTLACVLKLPRIVSLLPKTPSVRPEICARLKISYRRVELPSKSRHHGLGIPRQGKNVVKPNLDALGK